MRRMVVVGLLGGAVVLTAVVVSRRRTSLTPVAGGLPEWAPLRLADPPARVAGAGSRPAANPVPQPGSVTAPPPAESEATPDTAPPATDPPTTDTAPPATDPPTTDTAPPVTDAPVTAPATDAPVRAAPRWVPPDSDGNCPDSHPVKGNRPRRIYHVPGGRYYDSTQATRCFCTPEDAEADGYRAAKR
jgi:hypothetical protein